MANPTLDLNAPTLGILEEIIFTLALLEANPLTADLAPPFLELYSVDWRAVALAEFEHLVAAFRADALVAAADDNLDDFVDELDKVILRKVKNDRSDPLYEYYFKPKRPHELKRPLLGDQYARMQSWVKPLKESTDPELMTLGTRLETMIAGADTALEKQRTAAEKIKTFRTLAERKALIDKCNALRKSTDGKLAELPHKNPDARLPINFASRFFKHAPKRGKTAAKEITSAALADQIKTLKEQLAAAELQYQDALTKEEAEAEAAAQTEADKQELALLEKEAEEAAKKVAALKQKLATK